MSLFFRITCSIVGINGVGYYIYPEVYNKYLIDYGLKILKIYVKSEMIFLKYFNLVNDYLKYDNNDELSNYTIVILNNKYSLIEDTKNIDVNYDYLIYNLKNEKINYRIINNNEVPVKNITDYDKCNYNFMNITVVIRQNNDDKCLDLKLSTDAMTYYIVDNELNDSIIKYVIKEQHNIEPETYTNEYVMTIVDHNINIVNLTNKDKIIFHKDNYEIVRL